MTVAQILNAKGHEVITIDLSSTVAEAANILAARRIGAVLVSDAKGGVAGVFSERDMVRIVAALGGEALSHPVRDFMTRSVIACESATSIDDVMTTMTERRIRHIPVVDDGRLMGLVSIGDIVKAKIGEAETNVEALRDYIVASR